MIWKDYLTNLLAERKLWFTGPSLAIEWGTQRSTTATSWDIFLLNSSSSTELIIPPASLYSSLRKLAHETIGPQLKKQDGHHSHSAINIYTLVVISFLNLAFGYGFNFIPHFYHRFYHFELGFRNCLKVFFPKIHRIIYLGFRKIFCTAPPKYKWD